MKLVLAGLLVLSAHAIDATERLAIQVSPSVAFAPANLRVRTTVQANEANRAIEIIAESAEFYRSSEIQLDGDRAPRTTLLEFRSLPSGSYAVTGVLKGAGGRELASTSVMVNVVEGGTYTR
jgi:hypothetical protein